MAFNGAGLFQRLYNWVNDKNLAIPITASRMDDEMNGMATGLSTCLTKDGQTLPTANLPMNSLRHLNVANAQARNEYVAMGQLQDNTACWGGTATGSANAIVVATSPAISALAAGQRVQFKASALNTGATTINYGGGIVSLLKNTGASLVGGEIQSGMLCIIEYDGTNAILVNPQITSTPNNWSAQQNFASNGAPIIANSVNSTAQKIAFQDASVAAGYCGAQVAGYAFFASNASGVTLGGWDQNGHFLPNSTDLKDLGAASTRYRNIYGQLVGTITNDSATAGTIGEVVTSSATGVNNPNNTIVNVTSISLTAGQWDIFGAVSLLLGTTTTCSIFSSATSTTSANLGAVQDQSTFAGTYLTGGAPVCTQTTPMKSLKLASTTTVYLCSYAAIGISTATSSGTITAIRRR